MSIVNDRPTAIQPRQGADANVATTGPNVFNPGELGFTNDTNQLLVRRVGTTDIDPVGGPRIKLLAVTANTTASIPAGYVIDDVFIQETAGNAVTGGLKIGITSGGTEIASAIAIGAHSFTRTLPGALTTSGPFSATAATTIYVQAVSAWNSASVNIIIPLKRAIQ